MGVIITFTTNPTLPSYIIALEIGQMPIINEPSDVQIREMLFEDFRA